MRDRVRVAAVQMKCRLGDKPANLAEAEALLSEAAGRDAEIACLPELFDIGYDLRALEPSSAFDLAEPVPGGPGDPAGPTVMRLCEVAADLNLAIIAGLIERGAAASNVLYDTVVLINRSGEIRGRYRKSHLYPSERALFKPGDELPVFELDGLRIGMAICFEAAFPPIAGTLALAGAQVIFNPSAIPIGYGYLQDLRTRARAQDNQIFVVAVNHVGSEGSVTYCGRSQIAD
ncbi:MAG: carbon-nitrogen hydrolase family protein, partial [Gemmatimonadales bacterium]